VRDIDRMDLTWIVRRLPREVRELMQERGRKMFLAGGFIRAVVANEKANDIDLFTSTKEEAQSGADEIGNKRQRTPITTENAITIRGTPPVQFIHRWTFDHPDDCINSFDFTIAQAVVWWDEQAVGGEGRWKSLCCDRFYTDLAARRLVYTEPKREEAAGGSMLRVLKFYQRGYRIDLHSLGSVIARVAMGHEKVAAVVEEQDLAKICSALLREVDPAIDPDHMAHLPSQEHEVECDEQA